MLKTHMAMAADAEAKSQEMPRVMWPSAAHWYDDVYFSFFSLSGYLLSSKSVVQLLRNPQLWF